MTEREALGLVAIHPAQPKGTTVMDTMGITAAESTTDSFGISAASWQRTLDIAFVRQIEAFDNGDTELAYELMAFRDATRDILAEENVVVF